MSTVLEKCIDITPNGVIRPGSFQDYRVMRSQPWYPALLQEVSWLRLWADWPTLQPKRDFAPDDPASPGRPNLLAFDEQIKLAVADGLKVILMPYRYPKWVNGTEQVNPFGVDNLLFHPEDRVRIQLFEPWWNARGTSAEAGRAETLRRGLKAFEYRVPPEGHGVGSDWAGYVDFLWRRYVRDAGPSGRVAAFEVVNEPNLQMWPQRSKSSLTNYPAGPFDVQGSRITIHLAVAEMMATMDAIASRYDEGVELLGPSHSDADSLRPRQISVHTTTPYSAVAEPFVEGLLDELERIGFRAGPRWRWSYHNYNDLESGQLRVVSLRERLDGRWHGKQVNGGPALYATEGGVRLSRIRAIYGAGLPIEQVMALQAKVLREAWARHHRSRAPGEGVMMMTQYTVYADPGFDCAIRDHLGGERPSAVVFNDLQERGDASEWLEPEPA